MKAERGALGHPKIDNEDIVCIERARYAQHKLRRVSAETGASRVAPTHVVRLDVAIDEVVLVDGLDAADHLLGEDGDGLDRELAAALVKLVFDRYAEQVHDERIPVALCSRVGNVFSPE